MERQILDELRAKRFDSHTISFHVAPVEIPVATKTVRVALKSSKGAAGLELTASGVKDLGDDRLRQELLKLARTLRS